MHRLGQTPLATFWPCPPEKSQLRRTLAAELRHAPETEEKKAYSARKHPEVSLLRQLSGRALAVVRGSQVSSEWQGREGIR